jgi:hypothetical protein
MRARNNTMAQPVPYRRFLTHARKGSCRAFHWFHVTRLRESDGAGGGFHIGGLCDWQRGGHQGRSMMERGSQSDSAVLIMVISFPNTHMRRQPQQRLEWQESLRQSPTMRN